MVASRGSHVARGRGRGTWLVHWPLLLRAGYLLCCVAHPTIIIVTLWILVITDFLFLFTSVDSAIASVHCRLYALLEVERRRHSSVDAYH